MKTSKLKVVTERCGLDEAEGKYTGRLEHTGTFGLDEIVDGICKAHPTIGRAEVRLAIRALAAEIRKAVGEDLNYVSTGAVAAFAPAISGSVPAIDSALVPGVNDFYVNIVALEHLRSAIGAIVPLRDTGDGGGVRIDGEEDSATGVKNVISGTSEFTLYGRKLSATAEGESLTLVALDGSPVAAANVTAADGYGQRIRAHLDTAAPAGSYRLQLKSRGYGETGTGIDTYLKKVTVI